MRRYITATVDVEVEDLIEELDDEDVEELYNERFPDRKAVAIPFCGVGDTQPDHYVQRAYLAARQMTTVPREIEDMFWHVFGKAL